MKKDTVPAQLAALKAADLPQVKVLWRKFFDRDPPRTKRTNLEARIAYRIQELAYGGLKPSTIARLEAMGDEVAPNPTRKRKLSQIERPVAGTRLIREWQGVEYTVTVRRDEYEWQGRPYKSLSVIARAITGTRWNGPLFFGLRNNRRAG